MGNGNSSATAPRPAQKSSSNPSWGTGTRPGPGTEVYPTRLPTPHGERERSRIAASSAMRRIFQPLMGNGNCGAEDYERAAKDEPPVRSFAAARPGTDTACRQCAHRRRFLRGARDDPVTSGCATGYGAATRVRARPSPATQPNGKTAFLLSSPDPSLGWACPPSDFPWQAKAAV
jgi:hypothetical protein